MDNPFDKFDAGNPFDRFDEKPPASSKADEVRAHFANLTDRGDGAGVMGFLRGLRDIPDQGAEMLTRFLFSDKALQAGGDLAKRIGVPPAGVDRAVQAGVAERENVQNINSAAEADYQQQWMGGQEPPLAAKVGRFAGNVAASAPVAAAVPAATGAALPVRMLAGAAGGAAVAPLMQPTPAESPDEFWAKKFEQAKGGAIGGAIAPAVAAPFQRFLSPASKDVQMLRDAGVTPTGGQIIGGIPRNIESKSTSVPILGDAITGAERNAIQQFNAATYNKVLEPINQQLPKGMVGQNALMETRERLSTAYNTLLPQLSLTVDQQLSRDLVAAAQAATGLSKEMRARFLSIVEEEIKRRAGTGVSIPGDKWKEIVSSLGQRAANYRGSPDATQRELGDVLLGTQQVFKDWLYRSNPNHHAELKAIDSAYAMYKRVQGAVGGKAAAGREIPGLFTPSELLGSVRRGDKTLDHRAFAEGTSNLQDWAQAGTHVLGQNYPNSGTTGRLLLGLGTLGALGGGGYYASGGDPKTMLATAGGLGLAAAPYLPGGRRMTASLLASRGPTAETMRGLLELGAVPAGALLGAR